MLPTFAHLIETTARLRALQGAAPNTILEVEHLVAWAEAEPI